MVNKGSHKEFMLKYLNFLHEDANKALAKTIKNRQDIFSLKKELELLKKRVSNASGLPNDFKKDILTLEINIAQSKKRNYLQTFFLWFSPVSFLAKMRERDVLEAELIENVVRPFINKIDTLILNIDKYNLS